MPESFCFRRVNSPAGTSFEAYLTAFWLTVLHHELKTQEKVVSCEIESKRLNSLFCTQVNALFTDIKAIDSVGDPPLPIPNREVKPDSADGTAKICGRVGHRHFLMKTSFS